MAWHWLRNLAVNPTAKMALGERGEQVAARYLRRQGYKILVRRFRTHNGEIDIVARHKDTLVFIEVKTRATEEFGTPGEAVTREKQHHITKVALDYLRLLHHPQIIYRFDIVEVVMTSADRSPTDIRLIQNAFPLSAPYIY